MDRHELSRLLRDELAEALTDMGDLLEPMSVESVTPPRVLEAGASFRVRLLASRGRRLDADLPANLAIGYLADEEAAVDEFRQWLYEQRKKLTRP